MIVDAALLGEVLCNVFLQVFGIFHADDELVIGVEVGRDLLSNSRATAIDLQLLVCRARKSFGGAGFGAWFERLDKSSVSLGGDEDVRFQSRVPNSVGFGVLKWTPSLRDNQELKDRQTAMALIDFKTHSTIGFYDLPLEQSPHPIRPKLHYRSPPRHQLHRTEEP